MHKQILVFIVFLESVPTFMEMGFVLGRPVHHLVNANM